MPLKLFGFSRFFRNSISAKSSVLQNEHGECLRRERASAKVLGKSAETRVESTRTTFAPPHSSRDRHAFVTGRSYALRISLEFPVSDSAPAITLMSPSQKLRNPADIRTLFWLCWLVYGTSYLGRLNFSSATVPLLESGALTNAAAGWIQTAYFAAYGIGSLVNGLAGDRAHPRTMILTGLAGSAAVNALFALLTMAADAGAASGIGSSARALLPILLWGANGWLQSMIWAPIVRIFAVMLTPRDKLDCCINMVSSQVTGTLASYVFGAMLLAVFPVESLFWMPALLLAGVAAAWVAVFPRLTARTGAFEETEGTGGTKSADASGTETGKSATDGTLKGTNKGSDKSTVAFLLTAGFGFLVLPALLHGTLKDGLVAWIPVFLADRFALSASSVLMLTTAVPIVNLSGAYIARALYRRTGERVERSAAILFLAGSAGLAVTTAAGSDAMLSGVLPTLLLQCASIAGLAAATAAMMAVNSLLTAIYPLKFERSGRVSTVSGFLNALGYAGAALSMCATGSALDAVGWTGILALWTALTLVTGLAAFAGSMKDVSRPEASPDDRPQRPRRPKEESPRP